MPKQEHELERAAKQLLGEIQQTAPRFAQDLFPQGPAGHKVLPRQALLEMVANNWQDKGFREKLLERLSPPGPNGMPAVEEGIDTFVKLYTDAVLKRDNDWQNMPMSEAGATRALPIDAPIPQPMDQGGTGAVSPPSPAPPAGPVVPTPTGPAPSPGLPPGMPPPPPFPGAG